LSCGHRGFPSRNEEKRISRLLRKSGFIPLLDKMPLNMVAPEVTGPKLEPVPQKKSDLSELLIVDADQESV